LVFKKINITTGHILLELDLIYEVISAAVQENLKQNWVSPKLPKIGNHTPHTPWATPTTTSQSGIASLAAIHLRFGCDKCSNFNQTNKVLQFISYGTQW
jgi:hypothetical protein